MNYDGFNEWAMVEGQAADMFLRVFADSMFCDNIAPKVTCDEADIIASVLSLMGAGNESARVWLDAHASADEPGDEHYMPPAPDDLSGLEELK